MISVSGTFFKWGPIRHIQGKAQATALKLKKLKYRFKSLSAKIIRSKTSYASDCKTASAVSFLLYRKFLKSSEMVYNELEIKNDMTKERMCWIRHDVVYEVFCFGLGYLHYLTMEKE